MKCKIIGCDKIANYPYPGCDSFHGRMLSIAKFVINKLDEYPDDPILLTQWEGQFGTKRPTPEEIATYK